MKEFLKKSGKWLWRNQVIPLYLLQAGIFVPILIVTKFWHTSMIPSDISTVALILAIALIIPIVYVSANIFHIYQTKVLDEQKEVNGPIFKSFLFSGFIKPKEFYQRGPVVWAILTVLCIVPYIMFLVSAANPTSQILTGQSVWVHQLILPSTLFIGLITCIFVSLYKNKVERYYRRNEYHKLLFKHHPDYRSSPSLDKDHLNSIRTPYIQKFEGKTPEEQEELLARLNTASNESMKKIMNDEGLQPLVN